jgi:signal transduction histidine kinase
VSWLRPALLGPIVIALLLFGGVADRTLVEQAGIAERAALSDLAETARLTSLTVRATVGRVEESVLARSPMPGVTLGQVPLGRRVGAGDNIVPYANRARSELVSLLSSSALTKTGLPEAAVAAVALGDADSKARVSSRLTSGLLPVFTDDVPYLAAVLGIANDPRVADLTTRLRRAPDPTGLPRTPDFHRALTGHGTIEAWSRDETTLLMYAIDATSLVNHAGVADRVELAGRTVADGPAGQTVSVPDVPGLSLVVRPDVSGRFRIRALRAVLWMAILTSCVGLVAMLRAIDREARAVAREKAFLANMTHELRSPLATIRVLGETLAAGRGNPPEYGALVAQESQRLEALVEQVLTATRVDEVPSFAPVKPDDIMASALRLISPRAQMRSVRIDWNARDGALPEAYWDGESVRRALLNLLDNAVKHGKPGGLVAVTSAVDGDAITLAVADDGPGIGRRDRKRVFRRFERGAGDSPGTGLGLYVVEQVARAHGGRVDLVSEENRGCTFTLVLPVRAHGTPVTQEGSKGVTQA